MNKFAMDGNIFVYDGNSFAMDGNSFAMDGAIMKKTPSLSGLRFSVLVQRA